MIKSYSRVLYQLEKDKFKNSIRKVNQKREDKRMKILEEMKKDKSKSSLNIKVKDPEFKDRFQRLKDYLQTSVYKLNLDPSKLRKKPLDSITGKIQRKKHDKHFLLNQYIMRKSYNLKNSSRKSAVSNPFLERSGKKNFSKLCEEIDRWDLKQSSLSTTRLKKRLKDGYAMGNWGDKSIKWGDFGVKSVKKCYSERDMGNVKMSDLLVDMINRRLKNNIIR